jgi:putative transposase
MEEHQSLSHTVWDCKYHGLHPKVQEEDVISGASQAPGRGIPQARGAERSKDRGRASDARPRSHDDLDAAEIRGVTGSRLHQGQERDPLGAARLRGERKRNFVGQHFWARGFFVNTVGRDEEAIRAYIRNQEREDQRLDQLNLWR